MSYTKPLLLVFLVLYQSCNTTEPKIKEAIMIQEIDVGVKEAYLYIEFESERNRELILIRNDQAVSKFNCASKDTIITDTTLMQNTYYSYSIMEYEDSHIITESNKSVIKTLQPSCQNFSWEFYTFGEFGSSELTDITIIDENEVWGVGEIYLNDSLENKISTPFNAVIWNGNTWHYSSINFVYFYGEFYSSINCIFSLEDKNLLLSSGGSVIKWDGMKFSNTNYLFDENNSVGNVLKIWGISMGNFYGVGLKGSIINWNGLDWEKIPYNSENSLTDIWGFYNLNNNEIVVYSTIPFDGKILRIKEKNKVELLDWDKKNIPRTIWTNKGYPLFVGGNGIFKGYSGSWELFDLSVEFFCTNLRGNSLNDIIAVGPNGFIAHYNGLNWRVFTEIAGSNRAFQSVSIKDNMVAVSGFEGTKAIVIIGKRY